MRTLSVAVVMFWLLAASAGAQSVEGKLARAVRQRFGARMHFVTVVPYKSTYFGSSVNASWQSDPNHTKHYAIWEYVHGRWSYIFECSALTDADEEHAELDRLFRKHGFSPQMREKLMYGKARRM